MIALVATAVLILFAGHHGAIPTAAHAVAETHSTTAGAAPWLASPPDSDAHPAPHDAPTPDHCPASVLRLPPPTPSGEGLAAAAWHGCAVSLVAPRGSPHGAYPLTLPLLSHAVRQALLQTFLD